MFCTKCEAIDFRFLDELDDIQEQIRIRSLFFDEAEYWTSGVDAEHYYYYILHNDFVSLSDSVKQGCHLCKTIHTAFTSPPECWKTAVVDASIAMAQSTPIVMRSWSDRRRTPFVQNFLANAAPHAEIIVSYGGANVNLSLIEELPGPMKFLVSQWGYVLTETTPRGPCAT